MPDSTTWDGLTPPYATVVADPPWPYDDGPMGRQRTSRMDKFLPYSTMTVDEIAALPVGDLLAIDGHVFLWTTQRFLWAAREVAEGWGLKVRWPVTWCKEPMGHATGAGFAPTTEYFLVCRRNAGPAIRAAREAAGIERAELHRQVRGGKPTGLVHRWEEGSSFPNSDDWQRLDEVLGTSFAPVGDIAPVQSTWFLWPRGSHSEKPPAFMDLVDAIAPAPRVELFARAPRLGWDSWGKGYELGAAS